MLFWRTYKVNNETARERKNRLDMLKKIIFVAVLAGIVLCLFSQEADSTSLTVVGGQGT